MVGVSHTMHNWQMIDSIAARFGFSVRPKKGKVIIFYSLHADGQLTHAVS